MENFQRKLSNLPYLCPRCSLRIGWFSGICNSKVWVEIVLNKHGREIEAEPRLQQAARYRSLCSIFTRISSRASESDKASKLLIVEANKLSKKVEDVLRLQKEGDVQEKNQQPSQHISDSEMMDGPEDANVVIARGIKKKVGSHRGRRRIKSCLEKSLPKKKKCDKAVIPDHFIGINGPNPSPLPISHPSLVPMPPFHMVGNDPSLSMPYYSYHFPGHHMNMSNPMPWVSYASPQTTSFQTLFQQMENPNIQVSAFPLASQNFQASNEEM